MENDWLTTWYEPSKCWTRTLVNYNATRKTTVSALILNLLEHTTVTWIMQPIKNTRRPWWKQKATYIMEQLWVKRLYFACLVSVCNQMKIWQLKRNNFFASMWQLRYTLFYIRKFFFRSKFKLRLTRILITYWENSSTRESITNVFIFLICIK